MRPAVSLAALALAGCVEPLDAACGGSRPGLESCTAHLYDADCGGAVGEPIFACDLGDCRWFTGSCVAAGYVISDCPPTDRCCHTTSRGEPWAFEDDFRVDGTEVAVVGATPISAALPGNLVVTLDPDVVVPAEPTCDESRAFGDLCVRAFSQIRFVSDRVTEGVALEWWSNLVGADLLVEAYRDGDGELVGRAFLRSHIDADTGLTCLAPFPAENLHGEIVLASLSTADVRAVVHLETDTASITIPF